MTAAVEVALHRVSDSNTVVGVLAFGPRGYKKFCADLRHALVFLGDEAAAINDDAEAFRRLSAIKLTQVEGKLVKVSHSLRILRVDSDNDKFSRFLGFEKNSFFVAIGQDIEAVEAATLKPAAESLPPEYRNDEGFIRL